MSRTEISNVFGHNRDSGKITSALELLLTSGKARFEKTAASAAAGGRRRPGTRSDKVRNADRRPTKQVVFRESVRLRNKSTYCEISLAGDPKAPPTDEFRTYFALFRTYFARNFLMISKG